MQVVASMWQNAFNGGPVSDISQRGVDYEKHKAFLRRAGNTLPTLRPDRIAFRAIRKWLIGDGGPWLVDHWLKINQQGQMLRFEADGAVHGGRVHGLWVDARGWY